MVKYQLRHGNDLLAMDSLRGCDVSCYRTADTHSRAFVTTNPEIDQSYFFSRKI